MITPSLTSNLPSSFSDLLTNQATSIPENYQEFIHQQMQSEAEDRFKTQSTLLKIDINQFDTLLNEFVNQVNTMSDLTPRSGLFKNTTPKNTLQNLRPDRKSVSSICINDCFADISPSAKTVRDKQVEVLKGVLSHPNDFLKQDLGVFNSGEETVSSALKTVSTYNLANSIKDTTSQLTNINGFSLPNNKDVMSLITSNAQGLIGGASLPTSVGLFSNSVGGIDALQKDVAGTLNSMMPGQKSELVSSIVSKATEELVKDIKSVTNALGVVSSAKFDSAQKGKVALKDLASAFQQTSTTAFSGIDDLIKTLGANEEFKNLANSLNSSVTNIRGLLTSSMSQINSLLSGSKLALPDATKMLSNITSEVQGKLSSMMDSTLGNLSSLKSEMLTNLDVKVDYLDLPLPSIYQMIDVVKEDIKDLHSQSLTPTEQSLFGMITEIESFAKTKQLSQRAKSLTDMRNCIKKQVPTANLINISFINNLPLTESNDLDIMRIQNRTTTKLDTKKLDTLKTMYKNYKREIRATIPQNDYYKTVAQGVI